MEDQAVIDQVLSGDREAFAVLVDRHKGMAFTLALRIVRNREEAEEIAQDAFVKAFRSLKSFRRESRFSSWLYRIVYNQAISRTRLRKPRAASYDDGFEGNEPVQAGDALQRVAAAERKRFLAQAMDRLTPQDAAILTMHYMEDTSVEEVSRATGLSPSNVKVRMFRARKKLHDVLNTMLSHEAGSLLHADG